MKTIARLIQISFLSAMMLMFSGCAQLAEISEQIGGELPLSEQEVVRGLISALEVGAVRAATNAAEPGGFLDNELLFIAFPPDARRAANTLRDIGLGSLVDNFVTTLNRSAEEAAKQAAPIFRSAIEQMTFQDAFDILYGDDNAATDYFRRTTSAELAATFSPVISSALNQTEATRYWTDITSQYNQIPFVTPIQTDLVQYTTDQALDGLFLLLENEEKAIREDPVKRTTDILRRVFGHSSVSG